MTAKTGLFSVTAAAAIVTFAAGWAVSGTQAQVAGPGRRSRSSRSRS